MRVLYPFSIEISSSLGLFARPDTGSEPCSTLIPYNSKFKGIVESYCWNPNIETLPLAVGMCFEPELTSFTFNSHSPDRKSDTINKQAACQIRNTWLVNPRYQLLGAFYNKSEQITQNHAHACQEMLARRIRSGRDFRQPVMGRSGFFIKAKKPITPIFEHLNYEFPGFPTIQIKEGKQLTQWSVAKVNNGVFKYSSEDYGVKTEGGFFCFGNEKTNDLLNKFLKKCQYAQ